MMKLIVLLNNFSHGQITFSKLIKNAIEPHWTELMTASNKTKIIFY